MKSPEKKLSIYSTYLDHYTQSEYSAIFEGGCFRDAVTQKPIELNEGTPVRIIVANVFIPEGHAAQHLHVEEKIIFKEAEVFFFHMQIGDNNFRFSVRNKEKISVIKKGNKKPFFINTSCEVFAWKDTKGKYLPDFVPIEASSFNEAFTRVSEIYRKGLAAHTCNIYKSFYHISGTQLDAYREAAF